MKRKRYIYEVSLKGPTDVQDDDVGCIGDERTDSKVVERVANSGAEHTHEGFV